MLILFISQLTAEEMSSKTNEFHHDYFMEILLPGYNFYKKEEIGWGTFFLIMRVSSLYGVYFFHVRYIRYNSLYKSAQIADFYYGLGYSYFDPVKGGYKNTKQFFIESGRFESFRNLSLGIHLLFTIIGLYKGYVDSWEEYENSAPIYNAFQFRFNPNLQGKNLNFEFAIPLDF